LTAQEGRGRPPDAFEDFFHQEYPRLARALLLVTGSGPEAEDVVQEAMVRALERWTRVREMESPAGYVYRIAVNLHRRRLRRALRETQASGGGAAVNTDPTEIAETREQVLQALKCLSTDQRVALVLVEWLGLSPEEAGRVLGIKAVSVRGRLYRARTTLKECLGRAT
jgi:RNA polymerase sigma-70 factor (ECF subfamily)